MNSEHGMREPVPAGRTRVLVQAVIGIVILAVFIGLAWYLTSPQFHDWIRDRVVAQLEDMTGGRVEIGKLDWQAWRLHIVADNVTIHGLEAPGQAPYAHVDRIVIGARVLSLLRRQIGLRYLTLEHPVIHLIVYPDGHTNQPRPKAVSSSSTSPVQALFDLQVIHAEVRHGVLIVNDHPIPLDFTADDLSASMAYLRRPQRYNGSINIARLRARFKDLRDFDSAVAADFSLQRDQLDIKSLRLSSGQSFFELTGQARRFDDPQVTANYRGSINLEEMSGVALVPQVRRGVLEFSGSGSFAGSRYSTSGKLALRDVEYRDPAVHVVNLSGGAEFRAENGNIGLPALFVRALGGTAVGSAEIRNWGGDGLHAPEERGSAQLRVTNVSLDRLLQAVSTKSLPLDRFNAVGVVSGVLRPAWRGSISRARVDLTLSVTPPAQAAPGQLPVTASADGSYSLASQQLQLSELSMSGRSVQLRASGTMASRSSLRFGLTAGNIRDVYPLLAAMQTAQTLPSGIEGRGSFLGTLGGRLSAPQLTGRLSLTDFTLPIPLRRPQFLAGAATPAIKQHPSHFDSLIADVEYSPAQLTLSSGVLRRGNEQVNFAASAALTRGRFLETSLLTARLAVRNFSLADLQGLAGFDYPLTGMLNANVQVTGTELDPRGTGRIRVTNATMYGEPFNEIDANLLFAGHEAQANNIVVNHNGARVVGAAAYNVQTRAFRFDFTGTNFNLAQFRQLQTKKVSLAGLMNFTARGSGTPEAPVIDADIHVRNVIMNGENVGAVDFTAVTTAGIMRIQGRSTFHTAELDFSGTVGMRGAFPADLQVRMSRFDIDPVLKMFLKGQVTGHSSIGGIATIAGPLRDPGRLTLRGDIDQMSADIEHLRIQNDGPLRFSIVDNVLRLDQFRLGGEGTALSATGTVALTGTRPMNLRASGHINLQLLQSFNPDLQASGAVDFDLAGGGTLARPTLLGRASIAKGAITDINFPNGLSDINASLVFNQDRMQIQSLTASTGGGSIKFTGFATYGNGLAFNIGAAARDVRLRYPQGVSTNLNADLQLAGTTAASTLSGNVTVTRFSMAPQFDIAYYIARSKQAPTAPNPASPFNNMRVAVHVTSVPDLMVTTSTAKVSGDMDLNVRGTAARPVLLGRINITEGQVTFNGANYQLDRGDITFSNPVRIEPVVDIEVTTRVRDYDVTLGFHGPVDRLSTTYRSDPPLPTADIISLLAFGQTREESATLTAPNPTFTESASNAIIGQALTSTVNSRVQRLFGVSRVKIAPETGGAETNPNARVTIEQQVSRDFTVTYITDLAHSSQQQIIEVEYNYSRNLALRASRDQYGIVAFSVRIRQRKK